MRKRNRINKLLILYILFLPITHALTFSEWLPLPLIMSLLLGFTMLFEFASKRNLSFSNFSLIDYTIVVYLLYILTRFYLKSFEGVNSKNINHVMANFAIILLYYFVPKFCIFTFTKQSRQFLISLLKFTYVITIYTALYSLAEFYSWNFLRFNIGKFIFLTERLRKYESQQFGFFQIRGFTSEAGHLGLFFQIFLPLSVLFLHLESSNSKRTTLLKIKKVLVIGLSSAVIFLTFSAATIVGTVLAYFLAKIIAKNINAIGLKVTRGKIIQNALFIIVVSIMLIVLSIHTERFSFAYQVLSAVISKSIFRLGSISEIDRINRWLNSLRVFENSPVIGIGTGELSYKWGGGSINLYLNIIVEHGVIGFAIFLAFLILVFKEIIRVKDVKVKFYFFWAYLSAIMHYIVIEDYWYPWFWFLVILIQAYNRSKIDGNIYL